MKVLLIGATGLTGRILQKKLLEQDHEVTAFARNPSDIYQTHANLHIAQGNARDAKSIESALSGQDVVLSVFGPRSLKADDLQEVFMRNLVSGMKKTGVKRLVNLSAAGVGETLHEMPFLLRSVFIPLILGRIYSDKHRGELILFASDLEFVNIRPGRLLNQPARGEVKAQLHAKGLKLKMAREDLADFMIAQAAKSDWARKSFFIGY
jgi:uncharacterized protein YbjT (DUF2867 family)